MKELVLVVSPAQADKKSPECDAAQGRKDSGEKSAVRQRVIVHWDGWEAPAGEVSLAARLRNELTAIRDEHMRWAHDLGRMHVGGQEVQHWLRCGDQLSMWWCSLLYERHPKMLPTLHAVYKLRALERMMDAEGFTALHLCGKDKTLRPVLMAFCAASGRRFTENRNAPKALQAARRRLRRLYMAIPAPLRALLRYIHWWYSIRRKLRPSVKKLPQEEKATATIASYFPNIDMQAAQEGRFYSRYWEKLHHALNAAAKAESGHFVRWLFIRFPSSRLSLRQCLDLRDQFRSKAADGASFHYLEEFLRHGDLWAALWRHMRLCIKSRLLEKAVQPAFHFSGSHLNFWPYFKAYWAESFRGWRGLERCLQQRAFRRYAACAGPQRWTLFPLENCPWERMLSHAMHAAGNGPVYGAQHSSLRPTDFRYFDDPRSFSGDLNSFQPDMLYGNGQSACRQWLAAGLPAARLGTVEALRYLYLAKQQAAAASLPQAQDSKRLLVVTSFFPDETEEHLMLLARSVHADLLRDWQVHVKAHPYLPVQQRLQALLGRRAGEVGVVDGPIATHLQPGVLVWASNSTTVILEAAIRGLPVMAMLPVNDFDLCPLQDVQELYRTGTLKDVASGLYAARPVQLPDDYLCLDPDLPRWKKLLQLRA